MSRLEEFLEPLNEGVWEVTVSKDLVTEPLGKDWKKSAINVPTPGTIASFRKGQYHIHETVTEWKVHLDRYDPEKHPIMHLFDDAPLLLMIGDTFITLISNIRRSHSLDVKTILEKQKKELRLQLLAGIFLTLIGFDIISDPMAAFMEITEALIPIVVIFFGILIIINGIAHNKSEKISKGDLLSGLIIMMTGILIFDLPIEIWIAILTSILSIWMFVSAILLLWRVGKGRAAVPEGFFSRMLIGLLSLILVFLTFFTPASLVKIFTFILGFIIILIGMILIINSFRLRSVMKKEFNKNN